MNKIRLSLINKDDIRNCNCCKARNYKPVVSSDSGQISNELYEFNLGFANVALCKNCLSKVNELINVALGIKKNTARPLYEVTMEIVDTPAVLAVCDDLSIAENARHILAKHQGWREEDIEIFKSNLPLNGLFLGEECIDLTEDQYHIPERKKK